MNVNIHKPNSVPESLSIREQIEIRLREIEERCGVTVLHAVESGSRAWGFASPDSDYDVRFIYMRKKEDYLRLEEVPDHIDWELNEVLDINGWDIRKVLRLFYKSNATLFEWANSPIVYRTTPLWQKIYEAAQICFSQKSVMYHYYGTARSNYQAHLLEEQVKYKKYFYVLRPLLCCQWIENHSCPPPVLFDEMKDRLEDRELKEQIESLLKKKVTMSEGDRAPRIGWMNAYIEQQLEYYSQKIEGMSEDRIGDWTLLDQLFVSILDG